MAGFLVRRRQHAQELQAHDAELAKRAASALLAADEGIRLASEELAFAEAELAVEIEAAAAVIAAIRRHVTDAFRLNRLNHDAAPGTPDEVRARYVLILRLCEWAVYALGALIAALADRVAQARRAPVVVAWVRADVTGFAPTRGDAETDADADAQAHLVGVRDARSALDAATAAAREQRTRSMHPTHPIPPAHHLHHAIDDADRKLDAARQAIADHPGRIGAEARTRLAEAERIRTDLGFCLGASESIVLVIHQRHRTQAMMMAQQVASLASETLLLARYDLDAARREGMRL